jgi:uncharacterized protein
MTYGSSGLAASGNVLAGNSLPEEIRACLHEHHVIGLATLWQGRPWAASCFYAFEESSASLLILSAANTRHGMAMQASGTVAGTIAGQPTSIREIRGLQLIAEVELLAADAADEAYAFYCARHPVAKLRRSDVWRLALQELKFTSNAHLFASKSSWHRYGQESSYYPNL